MEICVKIKSGRPKPSPPSLQTRQKFLLHVFPSFSVSTELFCAVLLQWKCITFIIPHPFHFLYYCVLSKCKQMGPLIRRNIMWGKGSIRFKRDSNHWLAVYSPLKIPSVILNGWKGKENVATINRCCIISVCVSYWTHTKT